MINTHVSTRKKLIENLDLSTVIRNFYHYAQELNVNQFKRFVFTQLQHVITFKSALWITFAENIQKFDKQGCFAYQVPISFFTKNRAIIDNLKSNLDGRCHGDIAPIQSVFENSTVTIHTNYWHGVRFQNKKNEHSSHHNIASFYCKSNYPVQTFIILLNDSSKNKEFAKEDADILHMALPQIIESFEINLVHSFRRKLNEERRYKAICDLNGRIIEAEDGFINFFIDSSSNSPFPKLPIQCNKISYPYREKVRKNMFLKLDYVDGYLFAELEKSKSQLTITKRQQDVGMLLKDGLTNKEIGKSLNLSDVTIKKHIGNMTQKFKVNSRTALAAKLLEEGLI